MSEKSSSRDNNVIICRKAISDSENIFSKFNKVWVNGIIEEEFEYSHEVRGEKFYKTRVRATRLSGTKDCVPIVVSELLISDILEGSLKGKYVAVGGQFRSFNKLGKDGRTHLELFLFVKAINVYESKEEFVEETNTNLIYLDGYICKPPVFRTTPLGRQITELMVAVNRSYKKSDYIPCIAWGKGAQYARNLEVGNRIKLYGRIQSRQYFKRFSPKSEAGENRTAYEISIIRMRKVEDMRLDD